ncbi:hypothetical protein Y032_0195g1463 [Ancylostoma ceylanicum]|uniref:Pre-nudix hydrolase domain-containing protein n=1 Tax=Ancylostoma ceylanicum TaxID=53326 RepID=A0A016SPH3_9BILA|nr:hypothetical protein Y032_0195g1463 [Ancylostoma ceylanicum]
MDQLARVYATQLLLQGECPVIDCADIQRLGRKDSYLVPVLAENGFEYHDVKAKQVTMTRWLPDTPSGLTFVP